MGPGGGGEEVGHVCGGREELLGCGYVGCAGHERGFEGGVGGMGAGVGRGRGGGGVADSDGAVAAIAGSQITPSRRGRRLRGV